MNPYAFCRERGYSRALFLTFNFDALFFERVVLPSVRAGGAKEVLVIGDRHHLEERARTWSTQVRALGRRYALATSSATGTFHPKLILRLGEDGGMVWLGSGNLSSGGWGGNDEAAVAWQVGPDAHDSGAWLLDLFRDVRSWADGTTARDTVSRWLDLAWLAAAERGPSGVLWPRDTRSLADQLAERWRGRRFRTLRLMTGSTDERGAFLEFCIRTFGVEEIVVHVQPQSASFDPALLKKLSADIRLVPHVRGNLLHAKTYLFEGDEGAGVVTGSANCSAAAWLRSPAHGGNIELIQVFDDAVGLSTDLINDLRGAQGEPPEAVLAQRDVVPGEVEGEEPPPRYRLTELRHEPALGELRASVKPPPLASATLTLESTREKLLTTRVGAGDYLAVSHEAAGLDATPFFRALIRDGADHYATSFRWVENMDALRAASSAMSIASPIADLAAGGHSARDRAKLVRDLQWASTKLLSGASDVTDVLRPHRSDEERAKTRPETSEPVDPDQLIRSLHEARAAESSTVSAGPAPIGMSHILRVLLPQDEDADELAVDDAEIELHDGTPAPKGRGARSNRATSFSEHDKRRIEKQLLDYVAALKIAGIDNTGSARLMVEQAAFPIVMAILGTEHQWMAPSTARTVVRSTVDWLLGRRSSAFAEIRARYDAEDRLDVFLDQVGDGTLWLSLLAAIGFVPWDPGDDFKVALIARRVFDNEDLIRSASPSRLAGLVSATDREWFERLVTSTLPRAVAAVREVERRLLGDFDRLATLSATLEPGALVFTKGGFGHVVDTVDGKVAVELDASGRTAKYRADMVISIDSARSQPEIEDVWSALTDTLRFLGTQASAGAE